MERREDKRIESERNETREEARASPLGEQVRMEEERTLE